jgi:hypothetical protein
MIRGKRFTTEFAESEEEKTAAMWLELARWIILWISIFEMSGVNWAMLGLNPHPLEPKGCGTQLPS